MRPTTDREALEIVRNAIEGFTLTLEEIARQIKNNNPDWALAQAQAGLSTARFVLEKLDERLGAR